MTKKKEGSLRVDGWRPEHPERKRAIRNELDHRRRAGAACPKWVDKVVMREFFLNRPPGQEAHHIVPLDGEQVCGLHVPWNLIWLPRSQHALVHTGMRTDQSLYPSRQTKKCKDCRRVFMRTPEFFFFANGRWPSSYCKQCHSKRVGAANRRRRYG